MTGACGNAVRASVTGSRSHTQGGLTFMNRGTLLVTTMLAGAALGGMRAALAADDAATHQKKLDEIQTVVVIFGENRSFDNLYGNFPGANGLADASEDTRTQLDRDASVLKQLPPIWDGLTAKGVTPPVTQAADGPSSERALRHRRSQRLQCRPRRHHPRPLAPVLPEPDADRWRQERQVRGLGQFGRPW